MHVSFMVKIFWVMWEIYHLQSIICYLAELPLSQAAFLNPNQALFLNLSSSYYVNVKVKNKKKRETDIKP